MDKGLNVPQWVLIVQPKIPQMPKNLSAQFVCPTPKVLNFNKKILHWLSVVRCSSCCAHSRLEFKSGFRSIVVFGNNRGHYASLC